MKTVLLRLKFWLRQWSRKVRIPGGGGARLWDVFRFMQRAFQSEAFNLRAFAMAYNFFLAFFPALILVFAIVPFLPFSNMNARVLSVLKGVVPPKGIDIVRDTVTETFQDSNLTVILLTLASILFFSSRGVSVMMAAFKKADPRYFKKRSWFREKALSLVIFAGLMSIGLVGLLLYGASEWAILLLTEETGVMLSVEKFLIRFFRVAFVLFITFFAISFIYWVAPNTQQRIRFISPGSIVAGVLMFAAQLLLQYYFANFANYNRIYGSLTAVMVLLVWFYWISVVILLGHELNVSIRRAQEVKNLRKKRGGKRNNPHSRVIPSLKRGGASSDSSGKPPS